MHPLFLSRIPTQPGPQQQSPQRQKRRKWSQRDQKCIDDGDNLKVEILEGGKVIVTRI